MFGGVLSFAGTASVVETAVAEACIIVCDMFYYEMSCIKFPVS
jgi:hypothetical protein